MFGFKDFKYLEELSPKEIQKRYSALLEYATEAPENYERQDSQTRAFLQGLTNAIAKCKKDPSLVEEAVKNATEFIFDVKLRGIVFLTFLRLDPRQFTTGWLTGVPKEYIYTSLDKFIRAGYNSWRGRAELASWCIATKGAALQALLYNRENDHEGAIITSTYIKIARILAPHMTEAELGHIRNRKEAIKLDQLVRVKTLMETTKLSDNERRNLSTAEACGYGFDLLKRELLINDICEARGMSSKDLGRQILESRSEEDNPSHPHSLIFSIPRNPILNPIAISEKTVQKGTSP